MDRKNRAVFVVLGIFLAVMIAAGLFMRSHNIAVLNPAGHIASRERRLIIEATLLMLIVVIPVYISLFIIAWRYREGNSKAKYSPDLDGNRAVELLWWAIPLTVITVLAVITYRSSYELDPFKPLASNTKPLTIQVVALQWKWLFIYPEQNIASVNYLRLPVNTPINFDITSDAPMNSFWIPQLSGQIYAMSGMSTQLRLMADIIGRYQGQSANISGAGFASMKFIAEASSDSDFSSWVMATKASPDRLDLASYSKLARPSTNLTTTAYSGAQDDLYSLIINKYTRPAPTGPGVDYYVARVHQEMQ